MPSSEKIGFLRGAVRALAKFYYPRIEVTGGELIPRTGPVLLVANHPNSLIDSVLLGIAAQRPVRLMAIRSISSTAPIRRARRRRRRGWTRTPPRCGPRACRRMRASLPCAARP